MKLALLTWALAAVYVIPGFAAPPGNEKTVKEAGLNSATGTEDVVQYTTFNGMKVPPMKEIEGDKFAETIKEGYW